MTKEELKAKLAENAEFVLADDATEEEKVALEEAKTELAKDVEEKEEAERVAQEEADAKAKADAEADSLKASEKFISKADHVKEMNELKSQLGIVNAKLRFTEVSKQVEGYIFSESNVDGVLLPKAKDATVKLFMELSPKATGLFTEFLKALPKVSKNLFKEEGGEGGAVKGNSETIEAEANKIMSEQGLKYGSALKVLRAQKPELFK